MPQPSSNNQKPDALAEYRNRLGGRVGTVRLIGQKERPLDKVFVELTIIEDYRRPERNAEYLGLMDADLRRRRELFPSRDDEDDERLGEDRRETVKRNLKPDELLRTGMHAVVFGAPGCGKTTLLKYLAWKTLQAGTRFPVFLELKAVPEQALKKTDDFAEFLFETAVGVAELKDVFLEHLSAGTLAVFLDGLDEIRERDLFQKLCLRVEEIVRDRHRDNIVVVSTRPYALTRPFDGFNGMEISTLNDRQIEAFLTHFYGETAETTKLVRDLKKQRDVRELARVPFLLSVIAELYAEHKTLVGERLELYRQIVRRLVVMLDEEKGVERFQLPDRKGALKLKFLKRLAFTRLFDERTKKIAERLVFTEDDLVKLAETFCKTEQDACALATDATATPLLREVGSDTYAFTHLTLQEYLAAVELSQRADCEKLFCRAFFNSTLAEMEVLPMTLGLVDDPNKLYDALEGLPESLNFVNLRLRSRGLGYVDRVEKAHLSKLTERLVDFAISKLPEEARYADIILEVYLSTKEPSRKYFVDALRSLVENNDMKVSWVETEILGLINDKPIERMLKPVRDEMSDLHTHTIEDLTRSLYENDFLVRLGAVESLGNITNEEVVEILLTVLWNDEDSYVRRQAARSLGRAKSQHSINGLLDALWDDDSEVRAEAASSLGKIGNERALEGLLTTLQDVDGYVRSCAARSLGQIRSEKAVSELLDALQDEDEFVRGLAAWSLGQIGGAKTLGKLLAVLLDESEFVQEGAVRGIEAFDKEKIVAELFSALVEENFFVRRKAAQVVGYYSDDEDTARELLRLATSDPVDEVRQAARLALEQFSRKLQYFDKGFSALELAEAVGHETALEDTRTYIAHEVRNAIGPLKGFALLLNERLSEPNCDKDQLADYAQRIMQQTDRAFEVVNRFVEYTRPLAPTLQPTDINAVLSETMREIFPGAGGNGVEVVGQFDGTAQAEADRGLTMQVFRNVLSNAKEAMPDGGKLTIATHKENGHVVVEIRDTGTGIKPEHLHRVFDLGFTTKFGKQGGGIGLALVRRIMDAHRGRVRVANNPDGVGAVVTMTFQAVEEKRDDGKSETTVARC